jgi:hypothetical protein
MHSQDTCRPFTLHRAVCFTVLVIKVAATKNEPMTQAAKSILSQAATSLSLAQQQEMALLIENELVLGHAVDIKEAVQIIAAVSN